MPTQRAEKPTSGSKVNLFIVDTTFQLLNAIEAANHFGLSHNHLVVVNDAGQTSNAYRRIISKDDWERVTYMWLTIDTDPCRFDLMGQRIAAVVYGGCARYLHFRRMRRVAKLVRSIGEVDNLFLGHYRADKKGFMRHFANTLKHNALFIVDDGTDVIEINDRRTASARDNAGGDGADTAKQSPLSRFVRSLRRKYWRWDLRDAQRITFFTIYDLETRLGDRVVRNEYRHLRRLAGSATQNDTTAFLGQCLVDDGYMDADVYLSYVRDIKAYFKDERVRYVPHPRETQPMVERVREATGWEIQRFDVPVEYELVASRERPKRVASFFCSALESCASLFGDSIRLVSFHIEPEHLKIEHHAVAMIYRYFERRANANFVVVKLEGVGGHLSSAAHSE